MRWVTIFSSEGAADKALAEGTVRKLRLGERLICLARTAKGFFALADACPHRQVSLSDGHLNAYGEVICPLHNYCYALDTGRESDQRTRDAETYPLRWQDGALQLGLTE